MESKYVSACDAAESLPYSSFTKVWREQLPGICIHKPRSNLCSVCKLGTMALSKLRPLNDEKRREVLDRNISHLNVVDSERRFYKDNIDIANKSINSSFSSKPPCTWYQ